jgi:O-acetyl-ADP-ribose deacetylase (regulator of RNase III)
MKTVRGDIVALAKAGEFDIIVHGCNCFHTMGAGVALQLAQEFAGINGPSETDREQSDYGSMLKLGTFTIATAHADDGTPFHIVNAYTQYDTASKSNKSPVNYDAIRTAFKSLAEVIRGLRWGEKVRIGYPAIGAGLAGGDWSIISKIIDEELEGFDHTYVMYQPTLDPRKALAQRLRDACTADIYCDTSGWDTDSDDDWVTQVDSQIEDAIEAMSEAADLLDPRS